jgi:hypothetical protein
MNTYGLRLSSARDCWGIPIRLSSFRRTSCILVKKDCKFWNRNRLNHKAKVAANVLGFGLRARI